jgi:hypothetical protein
MNFKEQPKASNKAKAKELKLHFKSYWQYTNSSILQLLLPSWTHIT